MDSFVNNLNVPVPDNHSFKGLVVILYVSPVSNFGDFKLIETTKY